MTGQHSISSKTKIRVHLFLLVVVITVCFLGKMEGHSNELTENTGDEEKYFFFCPLALIIFEDQATNSPLIFWLLLFDLTDDVTLGITGLKQFCVAPQIHFLHFPVFAECFFSFFCWFCCYKYNIWVCSSLICTSVIQVADISPNETKGE